MNKQRMLIGAAVAIVAGLLASRFVYQQLKQASAAVKPMKVGTVIVAARPLPLGARLEADNLRAVDWPAGDQPVGTFSRIEEVAGRAVITQVVENEPILELKLAPLEAGAGLPAAIPQGMRAISIRVDDVVAVAGFVMPGTFVDVMVTGDPGTSSAAGNNTVTHTFLEGVRVLAAGQQVQQDKDGKPQAVSVVTLLVTPEQADAVSMASTEGKIHLALRNTIDTIQTNPAPIRRASLFLGSVPVPAAPRPTKAAAPAPPPKPRPAVPYVVEIIKGDKRESQSFSEKTDLTGGHNENE
jgi:pilus assembly protein CpaB